MPFGFKVINILVFINDKLVISSSVFSFCGILRDTTCLFHNGNLTLFYLCIENFSLFRNFGKFIVKRRLFSMPLIFDKS